MKEKIKMILCLCLIIAGLPILMTLVFRGMRYYWIQTAMKCNIRAVIPMKKRRWLLLCLFWHGYPGYL